MKCDDARLFRHAFTLLLQENFGSSWLQSDSMFVGAYCSKEHARSSSPDGARNSTHSGVCMRHHT